MESIRLQRFLSIAGIASRRAAEKMIVDGRVKVSGRVIRELGFKVKPGKSRVEVDNKPVFYNPRRNYILFHKPTKSITSRRDPEGRTTIFDILPKSLPRLFSVGRLDWDTEGVLLLTNDGDLAYRLTHPKHDVARVYHAKVQGRIEEEHPAFVALKAGVELEDGFAQPDRLAILRHTEVNTWLEIEVHIGRNRIIRRLFDAVGFPVLKLKRVAFGELTLEGLPEGAFRDLTVEELNRLSGQVGLMPQADYRNKTHIRFGKGFAKSEREKQQRRRRRQREAEAADAPEAMQTMYDWPAEHAGDRRAAGERGERRQRNERRATGERGERRQRNERRATGERGERRQRNERRTTGERGKKARSSRSAKGHRKGGRR